MKKTFIAFLFCLYGTVANAQLYQVQKPVYCGNTQELISTLRSELKENPVWFGNDNRNTSQYLLFVNAETDVWTLLQYNNEVACILGTGKDSVIALPNRAAPTVLQNLR
jgi:hypothetical protein